MQKNDRLELVVIRAQICTQFRIRPILTHPFTCGSASHYRPLELESMVHVVLASRAIPLTLEASTSTDHFSSETPTSIGRRPYTSILSTPVSFYVCWSVSVVLVVFASQASALRNAAQYNTVQYIVVR